MLKLAIQAIVKAEADIENRCTSSCVNLQISADTAYSCVNSTRRCVYVGLSAGCYPELALATTVPRGKHVYFCSEMCFFRFFQYSHYTVTLIMFARAVRSHPYGQIS